MTAAKPVRVLMVCTGNICRSPTAHGVLEKMVADAGLQHLVQVDSAGTHGYHVGRLPMPAASNMRAAGAMTSAGSVRGS